MNFYLSKTSLSVSFIYFGQVGTYPVYNLLFGIMITIANFSFWVGVKVFKWSKAMLFYGGASPWNIVDNDAIYVYFLLCLPQWLHHKTYLFYQLHFLNPIFFCRATDLQIQTTECTNCTSK